MSDYEEYLGDGLYVSFDGWQFCLRAPRENGDHVVYLDQSVASAFDAYRARIAKEFARKSEETT